MGRVIIQRKRLRETVKNLRDAGYVVFDVNDSLRVVADQEGNYEDVVSILFELTKR